MINDKTPGDVVGTTVEMRSTAPRAHVKITTHENGAVAAHVTINGKEIPELIGYEIVHDRTITQFPILKLHIACSSLTVDCPMIPEVPEPWSLLYDFKWKAYGSSPACNPPGGPRLPSNPDCNQDTHSRSL